MLYSNISSNLYLIVSSRLRIENNMIIYTLFIINKKTCYQSQILYQCQKYKNNPFLFIKS